MSGRISNLQSLSANRKSQIANRKSPVGVVMLGAFMYLLLWVPLNLARRFWWRWTVEGRENLPPRGQGMIIAVNHINWTDIHILGASFPYSHRLWWVAKVELYGSRIAAWFFRNMQVIPIKRGKRDLSALSAAEEALNQGAVLLVFPEGHRSGTGALQEGRGGAVRLAVWTGCPIVPVAIYGTEHGLRGAVSRKPIHVRIGKPYHPQFEGRTIPADKMDVLTDEMMLRIAGQLPEPYWGFYRTRMLQNVEVR